MKRTSPLSAMSFSAYDVERRTRKGSFYAQVDTIIDWNPISAIIDKHYQKGLSASGEKPYDGLLLFKMILIGMWNNLSDVKVEEHVNDSLSAIKQERFFNEVAEYGVDKEARWLKKGTKTYFGYKKPIAVDSNGLAWVAHDSKA